MNAYDELAQDDTTDGNPDESAAGRPSVTGRLTHHQPPQPQNAPNAPFGLPQRDTTGVAVGFREGVAAERIRQATAKDVPDVRTCERPGDTEHDHEMCNDVVAEQADPTDIDALAALIRQVDPRHELGAAELAERLLTAGVRTANPWHVGQRLTWRDLQVIVVALNPADPTETWVRPNIPGWTGVWVNNSELSA